MPRVSIEHHVRHVLDATPLLGTDDTELVMAVWRRVLGDRVIRVSMMGAEPFEAVSLFSAMQLPSRASILSARRRLLKSKSENQHRAPWYATKD